MRREIASFVFLLTVAFSSNSQTWMPVGSGISGTDVNTTWALCAYDSILFAGGWFNNAGGITVDNMAQWNSSQWDSTGSGLNGFINAMTVYNGSLYVGGQFTHIGGVATNDIAVWNGSRWMPVGGGISGGDYGIYALAVYNGILYAGGSFDSAGGKPVSAIAQWNDTNWSVVGAKINLTDEDEGVFALAVYKGNLYIAGNFVTSGGANIAQWNGSTLSGLQLGTVGSIYALAVYKNNLYAGGMISLAGPMEANCIAMWNNVAWSALDSGITGENGWACVNALTVYNNELYLGGFFDTVNGVQMNCITKWNGSTWAPVGLGINVGGAVDAMAVFNNSLYVGGGFDSGGGVYTKNIARLTSPASINEITRSNNILAYPDPVNNILTIQMDSYNNDMFFIVYNEFGQKVASGKLGSSNNTSINVSAYASGMYLLTVSDGNRQFTTKFIKN